MNRVFLFLFLFVASFPATSGSWIDVTLLHNKSDSNRMDGGEGVGLGFHIDQKDFYLKGRYTQGEVQTLAGLDDWDRWQATRVNLNDRHIFNQTINVEIGKVFNSGFRVGAMADAWHVKQYSLGFSSFDQHIGYNENYWDLAAGALVGYQGNLGQLNYSIDAGFLNHFIKDYRLQFELNYKSLVFQVRDFAKMDFTQFELGFRYIF